MSNGESAMKLISLIVILSLGLTACGGSDNDNNKSSSSSQLSSSESSSSQSSSSQSSMSSAVSSSSSSTSSLWTLVWSDEFSASSIDPGKWDHEENCWGGGNNEQQC